jgi:MSHA pilin protein MshD
MHAATRQRGFTFIELVMFIVIVGIAVTAVTLLFVQNVRYSADPLIRQKLIAVAKAYTDEIVRKKWDELTPDGGGCIDTTSFNCETTWQANTAYQVGDRVRPITFNNHIYEVTAIVSPGRSGAAEPLPWNVAGGTTGDGTVTWQDLGAPTIGVDGGELRWQYDDVDDYNALSVTPDSPPQFPDPADLANGMSPMPGYSGYTVTVQVTRVAWGGYNANDVKQIVLTVGAPNGGESMTFTLYRVNY